MYLPNLCLLFITFFSIWHLVLAQSVTQLFDWDIGTDQGRCTASQLTLLNEMVSDAQKLNNAALWAVAAMNTRSRSKIRYFFASYFGVFFDDKGNVKNQDVLDRVEATFNAIATFLEGGGLSYSRQVPFVYCSDVSLERISWLSLARDENGNYLPKSGDPANGYYTVQEIYSTHPRVSLTWQPWWAEVQNGIAFSTTSASKCSTNAAYVIYSSITSSYEDDFAMEVWAGSITMCPLMFDIDGGIFVDSLSSLEIPTRDSATRLDEEIPKGAILLHELSHLVDPKVDDYYYLLDLVVKNPLNGDRRGPYNANTYMYFSMAIWYYLQTQNNAQPLTFLFGWSDDDGDIGPQKRD